MNILCAAWLPQIRDLNRKINFLVTNVTLYFIIVQALFVCL